MIKNGARWSPLIVLAFCGVLGSPQLDAAPNFPDLYIDPDDVLSEDETMEESAWPGGLRAFAGRPYEVLDGRGVVAAMDAAGPWVYIDGLRFGFALDTDIRLRAGAGAPTLITEGMALEYYYVQARPEEEVVGRIVAAIELEPGAVAPR